MWFGRLKFHCESLQRSIVNSHQFEPRPVLSPCVVLYHVYGEKSANDHVPVGPGSDRHLLLFPDRQTLSQSCLPGGNDRNCVPAGSLTHPGSRPQPEYGGSDLNISGVSSRGCPSRRTWSCSEPGDQGSVRVAGPKER